LSTISNLRVAIASGTDRYPTKAPFDPAELYPELPFPSRPVDPSNGVYGMVRESLHLLGMDSANFGMVEWNPMGELIKPGDRVLIKPNFVLHLNAGGGPLEAVVTHASILRALTDYILIALKGRGTLTIGDAPQMNCDLVTLFAGNGMDGLGRFLAEACADQQVKFRIVDFREEQTYYRAGIVWRRQALQRTTEDSVRVTLGPQSYMEAIDSSLLYGADYDRGQTIKAHEAHRHEYRIASEVLRSDVVISVPKLKVHSKVGTTLNIKNMVGINTDKNHLAHYRIGPKDKGGDEFSNPGWSDNLDRKLSDILLGRHWSWGKYPFLGWRMLRKAGRLISPAAKRSFVFGNWYGNDTAWRMALDLNEILLTADEQGSLQEFPARRYFSLVDGVIGGQGDGPLHPTAYSSHVAIAGFNALAVDWVATALMGFDPMRIPMYANGLQQVRRWVPEFTIDRIQVVSNDPACNSVLSTQKPVFQFESAPGWRGKIERYKPASAAERAQEDEDRILQ
jgi:uncharacterized protein (DUF362 family)